MCHRKTFYQRTAFFAWHCFQKKREELNKWVSNSYLVASISIIHHERKNTVKVKKKKSQRFSCTLYKQKQSEKNIVLFNLTPSIINNKAKQVKFFEISEKWGTNFQNSRMLYM